jgi:hypothetical protein
MAIDRRSGVLSSRPPRFAHVLSCRAKTSHHTSDLGYKPNCGFFPAFFNYLAKGPTS